MSNRLAKYYHKYHVIFFTFILTVLHIVGLVFFLSDDLRNELLHLTPLNLMITAAFLLISFHLYTFSFLLFTILIFITGMTAEIIGVNTGYLFGDYQYLDALGKQIMGVPYIIGVNWIILVLTAGAIMQHFKLNWCLKALIAGIVMVILDILIEQVAPNLLFWEFEGGVPIFNYITWYFIALPLLLIGFKFKLIKKNTTAVNIYIILFLFFAILNLGL